MEIAVEGVGEAEFTPEIGAAEARRVWDVRQTETVRELCFRADSPAAALVLECLDIAESGTAPAALPMPPG